MLPTQKQKHISWWKISLGAGSDALIRYHLGLST